MVAGESWRPNPIASATAALSSERAAAEPASTASVGTAPSRRAAAIVVGRAGDRAAGVVVGDRRDPHGLKNPALRVADGEGGGDAAHQRAIACLIEPGSGQARVTGPAVTGQPDRGGAADVLGVRPGSPSRPGSVEPRQHLVGGRTNDVVSWFQVSEQDRAGQVGVVGGLARLPAERTAADDGRQAVGVALTDGGPGRELDRGPEGVPCVNAEQRPHGAIGPCRHPRLVHLVSLSWRVAPHDSRCQYESYQL